MKTLMRRGTVGALFLAAVFSFAPLQSRAQEAVEGSRKVVIRNAPVYPTLARSMNIRGNVKLDVTVAPNGTVKSIDIKGGHPILAQAAQKAVYGWKWEPAPHETTELLEIKFNPE
jgi:TonB family protein